MIYCSNTLIPSSSTRSTTEGNTLVICCEGNAGFYEVGIVNTPLMAGYSVLGWNIPGFASSTVGGVAEYNAIGEIWIDLVEFGKI